ncbi:MAG: Inner rane component of cytoplasmic domain [bacterium]|nr:Inner rane component of cytoplasmic domain [bacterium]
MRAIIQYVDVPWRPKVVELGVETISIGRRSDCQIQVDDRSVRRRHAEIFQYRGQYWIRAFHGDDLLVDGELMNNHPLKHLDKVRCGAVTLEYFEEQ